MPLENASRVAETIEVYQMVAPVDLFSVLNYAANNIGGYIGTVNCFPAPSGTGVSWQITLQSTTRQGQQGVGVINDWLIIENNTICSICPAAQFASLYTVP